MADRNTPARPEGKTSATETLDHNNPHVQRIVDILRAAEAATPSFAVPPPTHGAFDDLRCRLEFIQRGAEALKGIGAMMQPERGDFQMNMAFSSDAAAVFRFFGEALHDPASEAYTDMERLERAARGECV